MMRIVHDTTQYNIQNLKAKKDNKQLAFGAVIGNYDPKILEEAVKSHLASSYNYEEKYLEGLCKETVARFQEEVINPLMNKYQKHADTLILDIGKLTDKFTQKATQWLFVEIKKGKITKEKAQYSFRNLIDMDKQTQKSIESIIDLP